MLQLKHSNTLKYKVDTHFIPSLTHSIDHISISIITVLPSTLLFFAPV